MRPRVACQRLQAVGNGALQLKLECLVVGDYTIGKVKNLIEVGVLCVDGEKLVLEKSFSGGGNIRNRDRLVFSKRLLRADVPLERIGRLKMGWKYICDVAGIGSNGVGAEGELRVTKGRDAPV